MLALRVQFDASCPLNRLLFDARADRPAADNRLNTWSCFWYPFHSDVSCISGDVSAHVGTMFKCVEAALEVLNDKNNLGTS